MPFILYSHEQILAKINELKENALYQEKITIDKAPAPKRARSAKKSTSTSSAGTSSTVPEEARPSDPQHADDQLTFPVTATVAASPLKELVDVNAEMYRLPNAAVLYELMVYLHSTFGMQLKPVRTFLFYLSLPVFLTFCYNSTVFYWSTTVESISCLHRSRRSMTP